MRGVAVLAALALLAGAVAAQAWRPDAPDAIRVHPGTGRDAAEGAGWVQADFSDGAVSITAMAAPGSVTDYGAVFSVMNHAATPTAFCIAGPQAPAPVWSLHGDGLHWQSDQPGVTFVVLAPGEERQVNVRLDWSSETSDDARVGWSLIPLGEPGCQLVPS